MNMSSAKQTFSYFKYDASINSYGAISKGSLEIRMTGVKLDKTRVNPVC